jgi:hypothetical protein
MTDVEFTCVTEVLLLHDSTRLLTSVCTTEAVRYFGRTVLLHVPNSPDFTPSDCHLCAPSKDSV